MEILQAAGDQWHDPVFGHTLAYFALDVLAIVVLIILVAFALRKFGVI